MDRVVIEIPLWRKPYHIMRIKIVNMTSKKIPYNYRSNKKIGIKNKNSNYLSPIPTDNTDNLCNFIGTYKHRAYYRAKATPTTTTLSIMVLHKKKYKTIGNKRGNRLLVS
jgi:hypothetical protein